MVMHIVMAMMLQDMDVVLLQRMVVLMFAVGSGQSLVFPLWGNGV